MPSSPAAGYVATYAHNRCIVCASDDNTSQGIGEIKGKDLAKLMKFFWDGLSVEVKPFEAEKHEFCQKCAAKIIEFYDTNEVILQLEKHLRSLQKGLIVSSTVGINKLKGDGHPLLPIHKNLFEKWGNGFKSEDEDEGDADDDNGISTYIEDIEQNGAAGPSSAKKKSPTKPISTATPPRRTQRSTASKKKVVDHDETSEDEEPLGSDEENDEEMDE